jgi:hypothetical protein
MFGIGTSRRPTSKNGSLTCQFTATGAPLNQGRISGTVRAVGGPVNCAPCAGDKTELFTISAIGVDGSVLERYVIPLVAPIDTPYWSYNEGLCRGIARDNADIAAFELYGNYGVRDDLTFTTIVPPGISVNIDIKPGS